MDLDSDIYLRFAACKWFGHCGEIVTKQFPFPISIASDVTAVIANAQSELWEDIRTEAQGELTGYLAKHHYDSYGGHWNRLGNLAYERLKKEVMPTIDLSLQRIGAHVLSANVLVDLVRIALWSAYRKRFKRVPDFFEKLLAIYEQGHLPCGWKGDLDAWPVGTLVVF